MRIETARLLRKQTTPAEMIFGEAVRNRKLDGIKFLRQHPIPFEMDGVQRFFIADFYCFAHKLVVEIDGGIHEKQEEYDTLRTYIIESHGIHVVRFRNEDIEDHFDNVLTELNKVLAPRPIL